MKLSNLTLRVATAVVLVPLVLLLLFAGPPWGWLLFGLAMGGLGALELFAMTHPGDGIAKALGVLSTSALLLAIWFQAVEPHDARLLLTAVVLIPCVAMAQSLAWPGEMSSAGQRLAVQVFGPLYLGGGVGAIVALRVQDSADGPAYVLLTLMLAWLSDTGGYFVGRRFGKHKLYPKVSPGKTIEGSVGGAAAAIVGALIVRATLLPSLPWSHAVVLGALGSLGGQMGDLGESLLKRSAGVKDSGALIPGHGGVLDRIDALLVTAPLTLVYLLWR